MKRKIICPVCNEEMLLGKVDEKIVACCENKKCESTLVFGHPLQDLFEKETK